MRAPEQYMFRGSLLMAVTCARCVQVIVIRCTVKVNTGFLFCVKSLGTYQQKNFTDNSRNQRFRLRFPTVWYLYMLWRLLLSDSCNFLRCRRFSPSGNLYYPLIPSIAIPSTRYRWKMIKNRITGSSEITDIANRPP